MKNAKIIKHIDVVHAEMLKILQYVDDVCQREQLHYFIDAGTYLGAVRNNGFIPWDDDIDMSMPKADYIKFINAVKKEKNKQFYLIYDDFEHHCCNYLCIKGQYWLGIHTKWGIDVYPIKIDIRPLNVFPNTAEEIQKNKIFRATAEFLLFHKYEDAMLADITKTLDRYGSQEDFLRFYNLNYGLESVSEKALLAHPYFSFTKQGCFDMSYIFPLKRTFFEGVATYIPESDALLKFFYGENYMALPPEKEQMSVAEAVYKIDANQLPQLISLYKERKRTNWSNFKKAYYKLFLRCISKRQK